MEVPSINNLCIVANKKGMGWKRWFVLVGNGDELLSFILGPGWIYLVDGWIVWWTHDGQMMDTWHDSMMEAPLPTAHSATKVIPLEFRLGWLQWKPRVWRYSVLIICLSQSLFKTFFYYLTLSDSVCRSFVSQHFFWWHLFLEKNTTIKETLK